MSKITHLTITGIRCFDNKTPAHIKFYTPLTLIVGLNGSGKTTVIECLKYATTGDLPPNSKGGAFIHDPKLCGEKEVLANVKLYFTAAGGTDLVVGRSIQLTVKKNTRQQKTLEGTLRTKKNGERTCLSSRVAELDQLLPQYLGVSKAILDNVVFCHQEDSLWPMGEPATLKKKFDEIFEAQKYTKAIDNIKVLRKKQMEELGRLRIVEEHTKDDKNKGEKSEKTIVQLNRRLDELREEKVDLDRQIQDASEKSTSAFNQIEKCSQIIANLTGKGIEAEARRKNIKELEQSMKPMSDSDAQLDNMNNTFEERVGHLQSDEENRKKKYYEIESQISDNRRELGKKQGQHGRFQAEKDSYERQLQHRETVVKESARRHSIRGFDHELNDDQIRIFMGRIEKMARDQNNAFEKARRETQEESEQAQKTLNSLMQRQSAIEQRKDGAKSQVSSNDHKMSVQRKSANNINVDEGKKARLESDIGDLQSMLEAAKTNSESKNSQDLIRESETRVLDLEKEIERFYEELSQSTKKAGETARLDYLKKQIKDSQRSLDTMCGAHDARIAKVVGQDWHPNDLEKSYNSILNKKTSDVQEAESQRDGTSREAEQLDFQLNLVLSDLKQKSKERDSCEEALRTTLPDEDLAEYLEVIKGLEDDRDLHKRDLQGFNNLAKYYTDCLDYVDKHDTCKLCNRGFKKPEEIQKFREKLRKVMSQEGEDETRRNLSDVEDDLKSLYELRPQFDTWKRLGDNEIPGLERELARLRPRRDELERAAEKQDALVRERVEAKNDVDSLSKTIQNIGKYYTDIVGLEADLQELSGKQSKGGIVRTSEDININIKGTKEKLSSAKLHLVNLTSEQNASRSEVNRMELEIRDAQSALTTTTHQLKERDGILSQIDDLTNMNEQHRNALRQVDEELETLQPQKEQIQVQLDDIRERGKSREHGLQEEATRLSNTANQLRLADQEINSYLDKNGSGQLSLCEAEMRNLEEEDARLLKEQKRITSEISKLQEQKNNQSNIKHDIEANIRYRVNVRELESCLADMAQLESVNAEADRAHYENQGNYWQHERNKLQALQAERVGEMRSKDNELHRVVEDFDMFYKDARYKYKEAHIKVEATKAAIEDLGRYGGALDKAIMQYHSLKMEEINRVIEELWRATYQGPDVDTILIRSDNENLKGNKSYNYRVCMVKQDAEMDMRGRCSAGQKVLASIIIRLALAESFATQCGVIALDEPTTNLDVDNIKALATSLHDLIKLRRAQSNFQLIVITHDEDFLRHMRCGDFGDYYYRMDRTGKGGTTEIKKQSIADVQQ